MIYLAIGVFVFVALAVGGFRIMAVLEQDAARLQAEMEEKVRRAKLSSEYRGGYFNRWGRPLD